MQVWGIFSLVFTDSRFRARLCQQGEAECMVITIEDTVLHQQTTWWWCQLDTHCMKTGAFVCELTQCLAKHVGNTFDGKTPVPGVRSDWRIGNCCWFSVWATDSLVKKNRATKGLCQEKNLLSDSLFVFFTFIGFSSAPSFYTFQRYLTRKLACTVWL